MSLKTPSPEEFFGFLPGDDGKMIRWEKLCEYYDMLNAVSDRMVIDEAGLSSEGSRFIFIYVSSPENIKELEKYRLISENLADPEGLSQEEISELCDSGKAVCMQQYGLYSNEVGGSQMVPIMLHELVTSDSEKIRNLLDNVIFIIAPCSEPDGEIVFTDYYNKYLGTEYEGMVSPYLRHNWAGHSNNRDGICEIVRESQHINDVLVRRWHPQVSQDHHHQCLWEDRMTISPNTDPYFEPICPLVIREAGLYGAYMATALSQAGRCGVVTGGEDIDPSLLESFAPDRHVDCIMSPFGYDGGRLVAWEKSCSYVNRIFGFGIRIESKPLSVVSTNGSVLKAEISDDRLTHGMPKKFNLTHNNGPVLSPTDRDGKVRVIARLDGEKIFVNGYVRGEEYLLGTPCVLRTTGGKGEIVLYSFNLEFRNQNDSTFKLLFNALYEQE